MRGQSTLLPVSIIFKSIKKRNMASIVTVASVAVPAIAAALFGVSAVVQGSLTHALLAVTAVVLTVIALVLYVRRRDDDDADADADADANVPTTGQTVVLALSVVILVVWGALLVTAVNESASVTVTGWEWIPGDKSGAKPPPGYFYTLEETNEEDID